MELLKDLNLAQGKELLKKLKEFRDLKSKLGKRGVNIFKSKISAKKTYLVEYSSFLDENYVLEKSLEVYAKYFEISPDKSDIIFVKKEEMKGGMKVYFEDNLLDVSFDKIEKTIKNTI